MSESKKNIPIVAKSTRWIDLKFQFPFFPKKIFLAITLGPDRRAQNAAVAADRRRMSTVKSIALASAILSFVATSSMIMLFFILYLLKSRMGIDLVTGSSPLPNFLKNIGLCH